MYNSTTEAKIRNIPQISDLDLIELPRELTRIYAHIVTFRQQLSKGQLDFVLSEFDFNLNFLKTLAYNLETFIIKFPNNEKSESVAFVSGIAHNLIYSIKQYNNKVISELLDVSYISSNISSVLLFLIGNSQADAAEVANKIQIPIESSAIKIKILNYIVALAKGKLSDILNNPIVDTDIDNSTIEATAQDLIWCEIAFGIILLAKKLTNSEYAYQNGISHFDTVIELCVSKTILGQQIIYSGPYHLAKLLKPLEKGLLNRGVINIDCPKNINKIAWTDFLASLAIERPYLWENHKDAVSTNFLDKGVSAILTLPTGAGKSTLSELKIASCLLSNQNVIYLVPTHALEDQIKKNLNSIFKIKNSNLHFDSEYSELIEEQSSPILVMTPERCLTAINMTPDFLLNIGLVVFDEFHLIHGTDLNKDKRSLDAMYCLLTLFTNIPDADFLLISAMVENGEEISKWVSSITKKECLLFDSTWKPTRQLHGCLVYQNKEIEKLKFKLSEAKKNKGKVKTVPKKLNNELHAKPYCLFSLKKIWESVDEQDYYIGNVLSSYVHLSSNTYWGLTSNRNKVAAELTKHFISLGLKTLVFVGTPAIAMSIAKEISSNVSNKKDIFDAFINKNSLEVESLVFELGNFDYSYFNEGQNIGVHHGLLLPIERQLIEQYFKNKDGSMALIATATLAQGINLPAEIVIIAGDDRYNAETKEQEKTPAHELLNAAGRAGRAGQSSQGAVILIPGEITTIDDKTISDRWWSLKNEVFSKSDQCLVIEDPIGYFLDKIQDDSLPLNIDQTNALFRYKSEENSEQETRKLLNNSLYAYKLKERNEEQIFIKRLNGLLQRRNELDQISKDIGWTKEISYKTGIDPDVIFELGNSIEEEDFDVFSNFSVKQIVDWYFNWMQKDPDRLTKIFIKSSTVGNIVKAVGIKAEEATIESIVNKLPILKNILNAYLEGLTLNEINDLIPKSNTKKDLYLERARNFSLRLIPDISFAFGLVTMVVIHKANEQNIDKKSLPLVIRTLASCIREGVDEYAKLNFKIKYNILSRVETHFKYKG